MEFMTHSWICDPGYKEAVAGPRPRCSCGACVEGVLSRRMAEKMRRVADRWAFVGGGSTETQEQQHQM
jgi:hypothetical protein